MQLKKLALPKATFFPNVKIIFELWTNNAYKVVPMFTQHSAFPFFVQYFRSLNSVQLKNYLFIHYLVLHNIKILSEN